MSEIVEQGRDVVELSVEALLTEVVSLTLDGWALSKTSPGDMIGFGNSFYVSMYRNEDTVDALRKAGGACGDKPKMTRAETLQVARAAKAAKLVTEDLVAS